MIKLVDGHVHDCMGIRREEEDGNDWVCFEIWQGNHGYHAALSWILATLLVSRRNQGRGIYYKGLGI